MKELEMNDDLERILAEEEELEPMTGFSTRVMRAVREEAATTPPIPFPWARFLPGALLNLALLLGAGVWVILHAGASPSPPPVSWEWLSDPQAQGLLWAASAVLGTVVPAWIASKWASPRRATYF